MNKKIKSNILIIISIIIVIFSICIDLIPNLHLETSIKLFIYILSIIILFIDMKIKNRKIENKSEREKNIKRFLISVLMIYTILLATLLFIDSNYRRFGVTSNNIKLFSKEHFENYSNIVPFATIGEFFKRFLERTINTNIVITNIIGNIIAFAPFGVLIPMIFKEKFSDIRKFIILMIGIVFIVECIQFITMNGAFDVDDIILNVLGATIMFGIMKIKKVKNIVQKILE